MIKLPFFFFVDRMIAYPQKTHRKSTEKLLTIFNYLADYKIDM